MVFLKAQITLNEICVLAALVSMPIIPILLQSKFGPTYQDDGIFGLHALLLYVQAFPEAQTAVEF